jgi:hypothetical protein
MATTTTRKSRASAEGKAEQDHQDQPEPTMPYAEISSEEVHIPAYRPSVQVIARSLDGGTEVIETVTCEHPWAHTTPEIAARCGRKLAVRRGLAIGAPEA